MKQACSANYPKKEMKCLLQHHPQGATALLLAAAGDVLQVSSNRLRYQSAQTNILLHLPPLVSTSYPDAAVSAGTASVLPAL
jgi:hypothetical protein